MEPTLQSVLAEAQAIDTTSLEAVVPAVAQLVTDLQALIAAQPAAPATPAAPVATSVTITFSNNSTQVLPTPAA